MTITVPDDILRQAGLSEHEALVEFACRLFDAERLDLFAGARLASLSRTEFETELRSRHIPIYRPTLQDVEDDEAALRKLGAWPHEQDICPDTLYLDSRKRTPAEGVAGSATRPR
jgi:predicted HTH domain antitoxin